MIEVRSSYLVKMAAVNDAAEMWKHGRDVIWPKLGWTGRIQQMLHGKAQQSMFVWSSEWESLGHWEEGMARTRDSREYKDYAKEFNKLRLYGGEREIFRIIEPSNRIDIEPGKIEVRSNYLVPMEKVTLSEEISRRGQEEIWPLLDWSGQNQQMLHGKHAQSQIVWSSTWKSLGEWEAGMARSRHPAFKEWYAEFRACVDFGAEREIFRNL